MNKKQILGTGTFSIPVEDFDGSTGKGHAKALRGAARFIEILETEGHAVIVHSTREIEFSYRLEDDSVLEATKTNLTTPTTPPVTPIHAAPEKPTHKAASEEPEQDPDPDAVLGYRPVVNPTGRKHGAKNKIHQEPGHFKGQPYKTLCALFDRTSDVGAFDPRLLPNDELFQYAHKSSRNNGLVKLGRPNPDPKIKNSMCQKYLIEDPHRPYWLVWIRNPHTGGAIVPTRGWTSGSAPATLKSKS